MTLSAAPDVLQTDGGSQSLVTISVFDANGQPLRNVSLRAETRAAGVAADFGALSARNVVTNANGQATVVYTAPNIAGGEDLGLLVDIVATPVGTNAANMVPRSTSILLVLNGRGSTVGPYRPSRSRRTPPKTIRMSCSTPSASRSSGLSPIAEYRWDFGDGRPDWGVVVNHRSARLGRTGDLDAGRHLGPNGPLTRAYTVAPVLRRSPTPSRRRSTRLLRADGGVQRDRLHRGSRPQDRPLRLDVRRWGDR